MKVREYNISSEIKMYISRHEISYIVVDERKVN